MRKVNVTVTRIPILVQEIVSHWTAVNVALGGTPATEMKLKAGYTVANLTADRVSIVTAIDAVLNAQNAQTIATSDLEIKKINLKNRLAQFLGAVRGLLAGTAYPNSLPRQSSFDAIETKYLAPLADMANLWTLINADATTPGWTPPLTLAGGYALATFNTELTALRTAYLTVTNNRLAATRARDTRDALMITVYDRLKQYRPVVTSKLPPESPLLATIPNLVPDPGTTPEAVSINGAWNTISKKAEFTISKSTSPKFYRYVYQYTAGGKYEENTASVLGDQKDINILTFSTTMGLAASGAKIAVKCFVETTEGNEAGSNVVIITHP